MKRWLARWFPGAALALLSGAVWSQVVIRLDDSASPRQRVAVTPQWAFPDADEASQQLNLLRADISAFEVRLNTRAHLNRDVEIYLRLPLTIAGVRGPDGLRLEWQGRGRFVNGTIRSGERALVYRGRITEPVLAEILDLRLWLDGRQIDGGFQFDPIFELELVR